MPSPKVIKKKKIKYPRRFLDVDSYKQENTCNSSHDELDFAKDKVDSSRQTIDKNTKILIRSVSSLNKGPYQLSQTH